MDFLEIIQYLENQLLLRSQIPVDVTASDDSDLRMWVDLGYQTAIHDLKAKYQPDVDVKLILIPIKPPEVEDEQ